MRVTSFEEIYTMLGALSKAATGRPWWKKGKISGRPKTPHTTIYLTEGIGIEKNVVENVQLDEPLPTGESFTQVPWNTTLIKCLAEFKKGLPGDTALQAASRFRSSLYLEERFWDLWNVASLSGGVRIIDLSTIFREDAEERTEVHFSLWANVAIPLPLQDTNIFDIDTQKVTVIHVGQDEVETTKEINVKDLDSDD